MSSAQPQVIISMTSFPQAIPYAVQAIASLLRGTVLPDKLILYLTLSQFPNRHLPKALTALADKSDIFEVRDFEPDIRSYQKLIPALRDFPEAIIVTVDDDIYYHKNMLRDLLALHEQLPHCILAHRARRIYIHKPYCKWRKYRWYHFLLKRIHLSFTTLPTGVAGVLYPPHALDPAMLRPELFTRLAPTTDDIWFWAAAVAHGTYVVPVPFGHNKPRDIGKPKELSLKTTNIKSGIDRNVIAMNNIFDLFPEIKQRLLDDGH